jgi:hypothetical protein
MCRIISCSSFYCDYFLWELRKASLKNIQPYSRFGFQRRALTLNEASELVNEITQEPDITGYSIAEWMGSKDVFLLYDRSGSGCLNNKPRFISGSRAVSQRCRVVHGGGACDVPTRWATRGAPLRSYSTQPLPV